MRNWELERAALVIAHPGHELLIHHWLERAHPVTFVLTDGSGHTDRGRIDSTSALLDRAGATRGSIYGALPDRQLYRTILDAEHGVFTDLVRRLANSLQRDGVTYVVGDAVEGVNPGHDVCRLLLNAALQLLRKNGIHIRNFEYPVERPPNQCPAEDRPEAIFLALDDEAYRRKADAARAYPELAHEMNQMLAYHKSPDVFRVECLRPVRYGLEIAGRHPHPCIYEWYGEKQVAAGIYSEVIRFRDHMAPLAAHLDAYSSAA